MSYKPCPPPVCVVPPVRTAIFGSGRLFQPAPLAFQAPGYAYLGADQNPANPFTKSLPCGPAGPVCGPLPPATSQTSVVGAGVLSPVKWRANGVFADNYALPGDIAREPSEGWWPSETIDAETGQRSWITGMSGLGALALPSWFNNTFITVAGVRIPNWLGWGAIAFVAYRIAKKRGFIKNRGRGRRRNSGDVDEHGATELELFIENDGDLYRQQYQPILKNLATKVARGVYDHGKAVKLFMYLTESGAKKYIKEFGSPGDVWHKMFDVPTRRAAAEQLTKQFETENGLGNYKHLLPKKYQKNRGRSRRRSRRA